MQRVTTMSSARTTLADIMAAERALGDVRARISSGKELQRASDGPARALAALDQRQALRRSEQYGRNAADARTWLTVADSALTGAVESLTSVRTLAIQGLNASSDAAARAALADEVRAIREGLLQIANTTHLGRPIFAGNADVTAAYDANAAYQGDGAGSVVRTIAPSVTIQVNRVGPVVFGTPTAPPAAPVDGDVFQLLEAVAAALDSGDTTTLAQGLTNLEAATDVVQTAQVELGARARQVEDVMARSEITDLDRRQALTELEDVDISQALIDVRAREFNYQAALSVSGRLLNSSLLDFLR
jgi:flagellar hook-associated protein 3 FlgL